MLSLYFVYLDSGWIHAYLCVFACSNVGATLSRTHVSRDVATLSPGSHGLTSLAYKSEGVIITRVQIRAPRRSPRDARG